jgi:tRNA A37 threonylcarbamoyladenosine modification protein TsaB
VLLALDASLNKQSVAVFSADFDLVEALEQQASSSQFLTLVTRLQTKPSDITQLAVITGPGSFTGLRTALTVAKIIASERGLKIYAINNFELARFQGDKQAIALRLSDHDYYISLDANYSNPETNFFANEIPAGVELIEAPSLSNIGAFLKANPREAISASELQPYYLRLPQIGKSGESRINTSSGLKLEIAASDTETLIEEARKAMADARFADAAQLTKLYVSRRKKIASSPSAPRNDVASAYELLAEAELELGEVSNAKRHYLKAGDFTQAAFSALIAAKFDEARHLYLKAPDSIAQRWGLFLCDYLAPQHRAPIDSPGFMAFRLLLESTVSYMLRNGSETYVKVLLANHKTLETVFPELRKAIGSAYLGLKKYQNAIEIFEAAKAELSHDAELFYKLAEAQIGLGDRVAARLSLETVLKLLPGHIGSQKLINALA